MLTDPRNLAVLLLLFGAMFYGWLRYFRPGSTMPPQWERTAVPVVAIALLVGLGAWQLVDP